MFNPWKKPYTLFTIVIVLFLMILACGTSTSEQLEEALPDTPVSEEEVESPIQEDQPEEVQSTSTPEIEEEPPTPTPEPEPLIIVQQGFGQDEQTAGYGFKIENPNSGLAFESSKYQVAFFDENGTVVETDSSNIELILPGQILGIGGEVYLDEGVTANYFEVQVNAGDASPTDLTTTFSVDSIMYQESDYFSHVYGVINNPFERNITTLRVSSIVYNEAAEIVGGGYTYLNFILADDSAGVKVSTTNSGEVAKSELYPVLSGLSDIDASDDLPSDVTNLVLVQEGFGQSDSQLGFGMIIINPNENYSVDGSKYQVTAYAEDGSVIGTDDGYISLILPNQTLGFASEFFVEDDTQASIVDIKILSGDFETSEPIPPFSSENVSYLPDEYFPKITGQIASPYTSDITQVRVSGLCYDENGEINGGGFTYLDFVPANSTAAVEVSVTCSGVPTSSELYAAISGLSDIE